jgi:hypothetical protein
MTEAVVAISPLVAAQDWFSRVRRDLPKVLRAGWAQEIIEAFEAFGIETADEITADVLGTVAGRLDTSVDELLASMRKCPLGFNLAMFGS